MVRDRVIHELPGDLPVIPDGWEYRALGDLVKPPGICYGIVQPGKETDSGVPLVRVNNVRDGRIDTSDVKRVEPSVAASFSRSRLRGGEVLLTLVGTLGEVAIVPTELEGWNVARAVGVIPVSDEVGNLWISLCLRSEVVQRYIGMWATTTVQATFNLRDVARLPIPVPPRDERKAIANILGSLDDKIELNRRMNETLEGIARALFKSWFVDFDPVRAKMDGRQPAGMSPEIANLFPSEFEHVNGELVPKGWSNGIIGNIGLNPRRSITPEQITPGTPYIALEHMPRRRIALSEWSNSEDIASGKCLFNRGEILFGKLRPYFHKVGVPAISGVCSTDIIVVVPSSDAWFGFLLGHMSSDALVEYTDLTSTGTKMPRTNWNDISKYPVVLPPEIIAEFFSAYMRASVAQIHANIHESKTLSQLRDTLLPKLLSGELRVPEADKMLEEVL